MLLMLQEVQIVVMLQLRVVDNGGMSPSTTHVVNGVNTDNRPPYYALAFIMRID